MSKCLCTHSYTFLLYHVFQEKSRACNKKSRPDPPFFKKFLVTHLPVIPKSRESDSHRPPNYMEPSLGATNRGREPEPRSLPFSQNPPVSIPQRGKYSRYSPKAVCFSPVPAKKQNRASIRLYYSTGRRRCQYFLVFFGILAHEISSVYFDKKLRGARTDLVKHAPSSRLPKPMISPVGDFSWA